MTFEEIERRRTIRMRRSRLLDCKLDALDRPAIKIAETFEEYCKAFTIFYDEYKRVGYTPEHPCKMLYNAWSFLPTTSVFIFKSHRNVISTISLIKDTDLFNLPIDAVYKNEVDALRQEGKKVAEIGALVTQSMRHWSNVVVFLFRAVLYYCYLAGVTDVVIMVNPKHVRFYSQTLLFEPLGGRRDYDTVGAPAVALHLDLTRYAGRLADAYGGNDFETNLHDFFMNFSDSSLNQVGSAAKRLRKHLDPYSIHYFFRNRPEIVRNLSDAQAAFFNSLYKQDLFRRLIGVNKEDPAHEETPVLQQFRLESKNEYADTAFSRNRGLIEYAGQCKLLDCRVALPGLGGVGGVHLATLARTGVGAFALADFDSYSPVNINRQYGSDLTSFNRPKLDVMVERALAINPFLDLRCFPEGVTGENIDRFLDGVDILVDSLDFFAQGIRRKLFNRALEKNIPVITAAPAGHSCALLVFMPGGMNYDRYFGVSDETDPVERLIRFSLGLAPKSTHMRYMDRHFVNIYDRRVPSLDIGCQICAGMAATEVVKIITGKKPTAAVPASIQFDARLGVVRRSRLRWGVNTPWQRFKLLLAKRFLLPPPQLSAYAAEKPDPVPADAPVSSGAMRHIIRAGMQAPSGDNVQPWRFAASDRTLTIYIDRKIDASFFNVRQTASLLACGAAVQNMEYAAASLGLHARAEYFPDGEGSRRAAELEFTSRGIPFHENMEKALWRRCTNRRMYATSPVPPELWDRLGQIVGLDPNVLFLHSSGNKADRRKLARAVYLADRVRVERRDLHEYLMRIIRFDPLPKDVCETNCPSRFRSGMPLKNLHAGLSGEVYLRAVRSWSMMRAANWIGLGRAMPLHSGLGVFRSGGVGLICLEEFSEIALLHAGKALQRVWCALDEYGYALQPMAAFPLLSLRLRLEGENDFHPAHVGFLRESWALVSQVMGIPQNSIPVFMFRTGKAGRIAQRTFRHEPEERIEVM